MVLRALYVGVFLFASVAIGLLLQKPYDIDFSYEKQDQPIFEFREIKDFYIDKDRVSSIVSAKKAQRFGTHDEFYEIDSRFEKDGFSNFLQADKGELIDNVLYLKGNVVYGREDGISFLSDELIYYQENSLLEGKKPFILRNNMHESYGDSFTYNSKTGIIEANNIKALLRLEDK